MVESLFVVDDGMYLPQDFARGPWTPDALHGGPVAALVTRAAEACEPDPDMLVARITLELLRPVPVAPLSVTAVMSRPGRKVQVMDVVVSSADRELVWGRVLRIHRHAEGDSAGLGLPPAGSSGPVPGSDEAAPSLPDMGHGSPPLVSGYPAFHNSGAELRFVAGDFDRRGPASVWVRLAVPVVPGEEPTPAQRAAAAADFGNGFSSVLDYDQWIFINPDLTVHLERPPAGKWVCLEAATRLGTPGMGLARSVLWDEQGPCGHAEQSLVIERRP